MPWQVRGANTLGLPVLVSEQVPQKLGSTVSELSEVLGGNAPIISKTHFSMLVPEVEEFLHRQAAIKQVQSTTWSADMHSSSEAMAMHGCWALHIKLVLKQQLMLPCCELPPPSGAPGWH